MPTVNDDVVFKNVNEEGEIYNTTYDLVNALSYLRRFPNDTIVVSIEDNGPVQ